MTRNSMNEWCELVPLDKEAALRKAVVASNLENVSKGSEYHACVIPNKDALMVSCADKETLQAILDAL